MTAATAAGLPSYGEGYLDRGYQADGELVPRGRPGALLEDPREIADRAVQMVLAGEVTAVSGETVELRVASLCAHGDTPGALLSARAARCALEAAGVTVRAFAAA